jgi:hypothetical protein
MGETILVDFHQRPQRPGRPARGPPLLPPLGGAIRTGPGCTPLVLWPPRPSRCWPLECRLPRWVVGSCPDNQSGGGTGLGGGGAGCAALAAGRGGSLHWNPPTMLAISSMAATLLALDQLLLVAEGNKLLGLTVP